MQEQRRGRRIAMTSEERDAFLNEQHTCRVATVTRSGLPHVSALWFVWDGAALWLNSVVKSQRWTDLTSGEGNVSILVDSGEEFFELRGVEVIGKAEPIGEVPRTGTDVPDLVPIEAAFGRKYAGGEDNFIYDGGHAWLRVTPEKIVSWDFAKMAPPG